MFFTLELLSPQHQGKFAIAWVLATRGSKYVTKKKISEVKVAELCDDIIAMINTQSKKPSMRLSLNLAVKLVHGTIWIFRSQLEQTIKEMMQLYCVVSVPLETRMIDSNAIAEVIPRTKPRTRRRRTAQTVEDVVAGLYANQSQMDIERVPSAEAATSNQVNEVMAITLIEEVPRWQAPEEEGFGVLEVIPAEFEVGLQRDAAESRREMQEADGVRRNRKSTVDPQISAVEEILPPIPEIRLEPPQVPEQEIVPVVAAPIQKKSRKTTLPEVMSVKIQVRKKKIDIPTLVEKKHYKFKPQETHVSADLDFMNLASFLFSDDEEGQLACRDFSSSMMRIGSRSSSTKTPSLENISQLRRTSSLAQPETRLPLTAISELQIPTTRQGISTTVDNIIMEEESIQLQRTTIEEALPLMQAPSRRQRNHLSKEQVVENRQKHILHVMEQWDFKKRDLTIEDVCLKPVNRYNIAAAFSDLLHLAREGYVNLNSLPNSLELATITKGRKFI